MIMSAELACVAGPRRSVASCGVAIVVTVRPTDCMALRNANAAVSAPGWFG